MRIKQIEMLLEAPRNLTSVSAIANAVDKALKQAGFETRLTKSNRSQSRYVDFSLNSFEDYQTVRISDHDLPGTYISKDYNVFNRPYNESETWYYVVREICDATDRPIPEIITKNIEWEEGKLDRMKSFYDKMENLWKQHEEDYKDELNDFIARRTPKKRPLRNHERIRAINDWKDYYFPRWLNKNNIKLSENLNIDSLFPKYPLPDLAPKPVNKPVKKTQTPQIRGDFNSLLKNISNYSEITEVPDNVIEKFIKEAIKLAPHDPDKVLLGVDSFLNKFSNAEQIAKDIVKSIKGYDVALFILSQYNERGKYPWEFDKVLLDKVAMNFKGCYRITKFMVDRKEFGRIPANFIEKLKKYPEEDQGYSQIQDLLKKIENKT